MPNPTAVVGTATPTPTPDPNATATLPPVIVGSALFVRAANGDDDNDGRSRETAFRTIGAGLAALPGLAQGRTLVVGPGTYNERIEDVPSGTQDRPTVIIADPSGSTTQENPGPVILNGSGNGSMVFIDEKQFVTIDGFSIQRARGANNAGVDIRNSSDITVRNCEISAGTQQADGIGVINSNDVLIINNLIFGNDRRGVRVAGGGSGSRGVRLISNTIANNGAQGVVIGSSSTASEAQLILNIIQNNVVDSENGVQILVTVPAIDLYSSDTNLVFPLRYSPDDLQRDLDINEEAQFVDEFGSVFLLFDTAAGQASTSPAVDAGFDDAFPDDLPNELAALRARTTSTSGQPDTGQLDLGYHVQTNDGGPIPVSRTFYVRAVGDDERSSGRSPEDAFRSIRRAIDSAGPGDMVVVGPGAYAGRLQIRVEATADAPLTVLADPTGALTNDFPGPVGVDGTSREVGFRVTASSFVILDGFTIVGARDAGIQVQSGSTNITVRNCFIEGRDSQIDGRGDGITVEDATDVSLINNALSFHDGNGIAVRRSSGTRIINNTIGENAVRGIRVGSGSLPAENTIIQNNIVNFNGPVAIEFNDASAETATLAFNLVHPPDYRPASSVALPRPSDISIPSDEGLFVDFGNFRLDPSSPARNAADPNTDSTIREDLATRTTTEDEALDSDALDLGYHFPILPPDPTPTPGRQ